jgi:hypothetical protein
MGKCVAQEDTEPSFHNIPHKKVELLAFIFSLIKDVRPATCRMNSSWISLLLSQYLFAPLGTIRYQWFGTDGIF